jgi:ribose transport system permease protein
MKSAVFEKTNKSEKKNLTDFLVRFSRVGILLILSLGITMLNPDFLKVTNISNVIRTASPQIIIAFGMTFVMLTGGIDLSLGSAVTLTSVVAGYFLTQLDVPWFFAVVASLLVGALSGVIIGLLISIVKLPPAVASYGMLWVDRGLAFAIMGAKPFFDFHEDFRYFGRGSFLGVPVPIWIVVIITIALMLLLKFTTIGRKFYALGANSYAARASGLEVKKIILQAYIFSGVLAAIGGLILAARLNAVDQDLGAPFLMPAIASPVMGGTSMTGGQGGVGGTVIGALIMIVVTNGMNLLGISSLWQQFVTGVVVILAVWFDILMRKRS